MSISQNFSSYASGNIKKCLIAVLVFTLCGLLLAGCASEGDVEDTSGATQTPETESGGGNGAEGTEGDSAPTLADIAVDDTNILEFVTLGQIRDIEFDFVPIVPVTDAEIDSWIDVQLHQHAVMVNVTDRFVVVGDTVTIDFEGFQDGVAFQGGAAQGFDLLIGSGQFIPGFEEQILGRNIGEEFDIHVSFPEDYFVPELAGEPVVFRINLHAISAQEVPEFTDEFVQERFGMGSVEEYRAMVRGQLESNREHSALNSNRIQVWDEVVNNATIHKYPAEEVELRVSRAIMEFTHYSMMHGLELEDMVAQATGLSLDEFIEIEIKPSVFRDVGLDLILRAVAVQEGIVITDEAFSEAVRGFIEEFGFENEEHFFEFNDENAVRIAILADEVIDVLMAHAVPR
ncbi:MAG: trigger factor [Oscillospiraceae bacterium]|nr:trigger factor [Oscillospiraceae bacterium]